MAVTRKNADYREKTDITEFIGNPLIAALPEDISQKELLKLLLKFPPYRKEDRDQDPSVRLKLLTRIAAVHIPYAHDLFIARSLSRCICSGYLSRNPVPFEVTERIMSPYCRVTEELENYLTRSVFPVFGFSVLGISGVGKSCSVLNALKCYDQVIDHTEYGGIPFRCTQIVWLKVDCPGDASAKGLCTAILQQLDTVLGTSYHSEVTSRTSRDVLTTRVSQCLSAHHLGVLVIDDIQNLCAAKKSTTSDLLSFLIYLMETLAIPVVMVGTPKVLPLFQEEFQLAKRATGDGTVRMNLLEREGTEWKRFIEGIWRYQFTQHDVSLTEEMNNAFYQESVGNPFLCSLLYKLVQDDAITSGEETFTVRDVKKAAREKLCITARMRENMLSGQDEELRRYEYLWNTAQVSAEKIRKHSMPAPDKEKAAVSAIAAHLVEKYKISPVQAEKLASQAAAAKGLEDQSSALGYAITLCEAVLTASDSKTPEAESE